MVKFGSLLSQCIQIFKITNDVLGYLDDIAILTNIK